MTAKVLEGLKEILSHEVRRLQDMYTMDMLDRVKEFCANEIGRCRARFDNLSQNHYGNLEQVNDIEVLIGNIDINLQK